MDKKVKGKRVTGKKPKEEKLEKEKPEEEKPKGHEKQTKTAVIIMIVLIVSVLLAHWIVQESRKFEYKGLNFYKEKEGSILYYKSLFGYVTATGENIPFIMKFRNDPRELDKIPIKGKIRLQKQVVLSVSPTIGNCSDTYVTLIDFSRTLKAFSIKASAATTDKQYARENKVDFANCKSAIPETVIVMQEGSETKITQDKDCYVIEIKDCEIRQSFERFMLEFIANSMMRG